MRFDKTGCILGSALFFFFFNLMQLAARRTSGENTQNEVVALSLNRRMLLCASSCLCRPGGLECTCLVGVCATARISVKRAKCIYRWAVVRLCDEFELVDPTVSCLLQSWSTALIG